MTTETPETDAAICQRLHIPNVWGFKEHDRVWEFVRAEFARKLERERDSLSEGYPGIAHDFETMRQQRDELAEALLGIERICRNGNPFKNNMPLIAERTRAALAKVQQTALDL